MSRRRLVLVGVATFTVAVGAALWASLTAPPAFAGRVTMYKSPTCTCCEKWADHMRAAGFEVDSRAVSNLPAIKAEHGIGYPLESCHTAVIDGYVIEGHVPAKVVKRLLEERPAIRGLTAPGMPLGSPGMEGPVKEPFNVLALDHQGRIAVYASVR